MREIRLSGSVRGADREVRPYRDPIIPVHSTVLFCCSADDAGQSHESSKAARKAALLRCLMRREGGIHSHHFAGISSC